MALLRAVVHAAAKGISRLLPSGSHRAVYLACSRYAWSRALVDGVLRYMVPEQVQLGGVVVALNQRDPVVSGSLALGIYEPHESRLFVQQLRAGDVVFDVGANVGYYTALAAHAVGPQGKVVAFEPEPVNFSTLQRTVALNQFTNVLCQQLAVAEAAGVGTLYLSERNSGDHRLYQHGTGQQTSTVRTVDLDSFATDHGFGRLDVLKMDIQGAEGLALRGAEQLLLRCRPRLFLEFYPDGLQATGVVPGEFLHWLTQRGYTIFEVREVPSKLEPVTSLEALTKTCGAGGYTNLFCRPL